MSLTLSIPFERYIQALTDTLTMVGISASIAFVAGIPLAILLIVTAPGGFLASPRIHRSVGSVVNGFRATPFIVLLVALIPFTRLITGTTIGVWAAIVPLAISATPFFARIAEVSLREVDPGLIEAAQAMGCRKWHIIWHVYLPEALPGIVGGFTITLVALISSSAMAGAVGAGGLGDLAIRYGYQRFDTQVMLIVIAVLIALVSLVQFTGDRWVRWLRSR
ncbi:ABC transporter permease [Acidovorax sp. DW039]|uniref:methionine ABC transporter permease n=1 Tax=Acidovorax sp. DW039 TaxID=3095606 RepID=UPI00308522D4|nr:ABC transporter permease [Acidovorax sp. DW039]